MSSLRRVFAVGAVPLQLFASLALLGAMLTGTAHPGVTSSGVSSPEDASPTEALPRAPRTTVAAYTLDARLDPEAHTIRGRGTIDFTNVSTRPLDHLFVHLYLGAFESDRTVFYRGSGRPFRGGAWRGRGHVEVARFAVPAWGGENLWPPSATTPDDPDDRTDIRVPLPRALPPGETVRIELEWESLLPPVALRTGHAGSFHMAAQWFPKLAKLEPDGTFAHFPFERLSEFYADFSDWDVTVHTPRGFLVGATGAQTSEVEEGEAIARRFVQRGVHDFAFTAWDGFGELRAEHRGVALRCLFPEGHDEAARLELEVVRHGLDLLGARYGAYPFETLTIVHPPAEAREAGGMEYPTLITTGGPWWGPASGARMTELVTIHELAHQWFQGLVASNEREFPFLDEGLTTFAEIDAMDALAAPHSSLSLALGLPLATEGFYRARAVEPARRSQVARPSREFEDGGDYGALVYGRTAILLRTLDRVHDGAMRRALGVYARRFRFAHPTPEDLLTVVREEIGEGAEAALRLGLFERGSIDVSVEGVASRAASGGGWEVAIDLERAGAIELPVEVDVTDAAGVTHRLRWDGRGRSTTLEVHTAEPPRFVLVDPERRLLLDDDLLDGAWASRASPALAGRTLGAGSFLVRAALAALGP